MRLSGAEGKRAVTLLDVGIVHARSERMRSDRLHRGGMNGADVAEKRIARLEDASGAQCQDGSGQQQWLLVHRHS